MNRMMTGPHVVVVDDSSDIQDLIRTFFSTKGYRVSTYSDVDVAIEDFLREGESWDVLLNEFHFAGTPKGSFTEKVKKIRPDLPIILFAISESPNAGFQPGHAGTYDFVVSHLNFPQLLYSVEKALDHKTLPSRNTDSCQKITMQTPGLGPIVGHSPKFATALELARRVATSSANISIFGESGTGKELFAKYIHNQSHRAKGPFVAINCSAIPENLLESELFGHAKGAFTGAIQKKIGLFEEAENGTLFLDEIGDLSLNLQAKLLRVLQERKIKRVGENQFHDINARIISATHRDLAKDICTGAFREDLYYRLSVIPVMIPPLRERVDDIVPLAENFLGKFAQENSSPARYFSRDAIQYLLANHWRGNVRELENAVERAVVLATTAEVSAADFEVSALDRPVREDGSAAEVEGAARFVLEIQGQLPTLDEVMQKYIKFAVCCNGGARERTAKEIGIDRKTLSKRLRNELGAGKNLHLLPTHREAEFKNLAH